MRTLILAAVAATSFFAPAANAEQLQQAPTASIRISDLDLTSPEGSAMFDRRLWQAARNVCGVEAPVTLAMQSRRYACEQDVIAQGHALRDQRIAAAGRSPTTIATR